METVGALVALVAKKAGLDPNNENLINILANAELSKVPVHSEVFSQIEKTLLSVNQAKDNHPDIGPIYKAQALNGVDKRLEKLIEKLNLPEEKVAEINANKSTYAKVDAIFDAALEAKAKDDGSQSKDDKAVALQAQVDTLLKELNIVKSTSKAEVDKAKADSDQTIKTFKTAYQLNNEFAKLKTIHDNLDPETRGTIISALINKQLQSENAEFDFDDAGNFIVRKKDGTNVIGANHEKHTPTSFIESSLAQNKLLAVTPNQQPNQQQPQNGQQQPNKQQPTTFVIANGDGPQGNNQTIANLNRQRREAAAQ